MSDVAPREEAVNLLQEFGLKEYESRCFVALTALADASAKELSDATEVPRTRVYDAIRVLEAKGLVEIQHGSPQRFRAVTIGEATNTLKSQYDDRISSLGVLLDDVSLETDPEPDPLTDEVWALSNRDAIESRTHRLLDDAETEIVIVVPDSSSLTARDGETLHSASDRGVNVLIGAVSRDDRSALTAEFPGANVFETGLDWLTGPAGENEAAIDRLLMTDRSTLLISTTTAGSGPEQKHGVYASGLENGLVVIARRILSTGLLESENVD